MLTNLKKYFWDADLINLNLKTHKRYILERILEMGDEEVVRWMKKNFSKKDILAALKNTRRFSPKSLNFWNLVLNK